MKDLIIIGAGPAGLSCAIEAQKQSLEYLVIEKGCIVNSLYHFPENMVFFSTPENLEIGGIPFMFPGKRPDRVAALDYYRRVAGYYHLNIHQYEEVTGTEREDRIFHIQTKTAGGTELTYQARNLVYATGFFDYPNRLDVPGWDLPKVHQRYSSSHPFYGLKAAVIGAGNNAVEAALDLFRAGVEVTMIHRGENVSSGVKYWVIPDIRNRIEKGEITALFNSAVLEIEESKIKVKTAGKEDWLDNDIVFSLIGYTPDTEPLKNLGVGIDDVTGIPTHSVDTYRTNIQGLYVCGAIAAGNNANSIFIENGKLHGKKIVSEISG